MADQERDLTIKVGIDNTEAKRSSEETVDGLKRIDRTAKEAGDTQEQASKRAGKAAREAGQAGEQAMNATHAAAARAKGVMDDFALSFAKSAAAGLSMNAVVGVLKDVGAATAEAAAKQREWASEFIRTRDAMRELSNLMGKTATTEGTLEQLQFAARTGMAVDAATRFRTAFQNTGAQFVGQTISEGEAAQLQEQLGQFAVTRGLNEDVVADIGARMMGFRDWKQFGDDASERIMAQVAKALGTLESGSGDTSQLLPQFSKAMASFVNEDAMKGLIQDPATAAQWISLFAETRPGEEFTSFSSLVRGMRDFGSKESRALFKKAGYTDQWSFEEGLELIKPIIEEEAQNRNVSVQDVLPKYFPEISQREAIGIALTRGIGPQGVVNVRERQTAHITPESVMQNIQNAMQDPMGPFAARRAQAQLEAAKMERGAPLANVETLRKQAEAALIAEGLIETPEAAARDVVGNHLLGFQSLIGWGGMREETIQKRMRDTLLRRAREQGGLISDETRGLLDTSMGAGIGPLDLAIGGITGNKPMSGDQALMRAVQELQAQKVNPLADTSGAAAMKQAVAEGVREGAAAAARNQQPKTMTKPTPGGGRAAVQR